MERDSQEQRAYAPSWPPGFLTGSLLFDTEARARKRDALTTVCLAVSAFCTGFGLTNWAFDSSEKAALKRAAVEAAAQHGSQSLALTGARDLMAVAEPIAPEPRRVAEAAERAKVVSPGNLSPQVQKRPKPAKRALLPAEATQSPAAHPEPTPAVSVDELNEALAHADASKRIFASLDETSPKPVVVAPPPPLPRPALQPVAAAGRSAEPARTATVVAIEGLSVDGGLTSTAVNRGVQRLLPQYDRCREQSNTPPQRLKLSTTIDEAGRGRRITVEGLSQPALRHCLEQATTHLVVTAPDTGTARARWIVRFAAR